MSLSLFHTLPGYPGDLFSRLFFPAVVVAAGLAGRFVVLWTARARRGNLFIVGGVVGLGVTGVLWVNEWFHIVNLRPEVVREDHFRRALAGLPADTTILYGEADVSLMVSLLNGGQRFGALAYPMLAGTPSLEPLIQAQKPRVNVLQAPRPLNTLAVQRVKSLTTRRLAFFLPVTDRVGWATFPGNADPNRDVAEACASALLKIAAAQ